MVNLLVAWPHCRALLKVCARFAPDSRPFDPRALHPPNHYNFKPFRFIQTDMSTAGVQVQVYGRAELWRAYREAFQEFARRVEELESQKGTGNVDRTFFHKMLWELEKARVHYRQSRDVLASVLLSDQPCRFAEVQWLSHPSDDGQRVREIAQLLWDFEARREGSADDDWYRAEEIIRSATAADANPACGVSVPPTSFCC